MTRGNKTLELQYKYQLYASKALFLRMPIASLPTASLSLISSAECPRFVFCEVARRPGPSGKCRATRRATRDAPTRATLRACAGGRGRGLGRGMRKAREFLAGARKRQKRSEGGGGGGVGTTTPFDNNYATTTTKGTWQQSKSEASLLCVRACLLYFEGEK